MRKWIDLFENQGLSENALDGPNHFDGTLFHATSQSRARSCLAKGVKPVSYWAIGIVSEYYIETVEDEGDEGVTLEAHLSEFDEELLEPDYPGLEEPITSAVGKNEDQIWSEWESSEKTWRDSLRIIGSVRYRGTIKPRLSDGYDA
jgi:hypothetical protein